MPPFEELMLPHLPTAYNLARWLVRNEHDAEDCVQEAYLKAFRAFDRFRGEDGRAWLLTIVRHVCHDRLRRLRGFEAPESFDEAIHSTPMEDVAADRLRGELGAAQLQTALDSLPAAAREIIVLHDLEGLAYRDIATVLAIPLGTVMSRLARARQRLQHQVLHRAKQGHPHEL